MKFDIITIFPKIFSAKGGSVSGGDSFGYFSQSIIKRAIDKKIIEIEVHNLRDYTTDKHKTVDDTPYGGGAGMVLKIEPIYNCVNAIKKQEAKTPPRLAEISACRREAGKKQTRRVILFSAKGKKYTQKDAKRLSKYNQLIFICGRYEGVDERVAEKIADEEISIGDFVLTGGEIPAMVVVDSITRLLPGVLGNDQSAIFESHSEDGYLEHAQYTKPEEFNKWKVPKILLSGHHAEIEKWRKKKSKHK